MAATAYLSDCALIWKIISFKPLNKHALHVMIKAIWSSFIGLTIEYLHNNTFTLDDPFPTKISDLDINILCEILKRK